MKSIISSLVLLGIFTATFGFEVCDDSNLKCVLWKKYCDNPRFKYYMEMNCRRTCDWCPKCEDISNTCASQKQYCMDPANMDHMTKNCAKTCGFCSPPTTEPPPPATPTWKVVPAGKCGVPKVSQGRVINGVDAKKGAWPWQILMRFIGQPHCGGAVVSPFWVVTAAHCVDGKQALMKEFKIEVGDHDFNQDEGTETSIGVSKIIMHPEYSTPSLYDKDIALMKLSRPVPFAKDVGTVCLPEQDDAVPVGTDCYITGWGKISRDSWAQMHHKLQQARLPVVENSKCKNLNENSTNIPVTSNMLCAGRGPFDPTSGCHGDSGGPFVCQTGPNGSWQLHGAVSWGSSSCFTGEAYTVFARVTNFRNWLDKTMAEN